MVYTLDESAGACSRSPRNTISRQCMFCSYARGDAREDSDVDLLVDLAGAELSGFFAIGGLYNDLEAALQKGIDLITAESLEQPSNKMSDKLFRDIVNQERREIYAVA